MIIGFHHPGISVPDLEKAREFYTRVLGFEVLFEEKWDAPNSVYDQGVGLENSSARGYVLKGANCYLELWQYTAPAAAGDPLQEGANDYGISHLGFEVDDVPAEYERLKSLGGIVMNPPVAFSDGGSAVYCRDPFGNIIEFTTAGKGFPALNELTMISDAQ